MEKAEIRDVVLKHVRENVDGLEGVDIDTQKSMADYSASSLDSDSLPGLIRCTRHRY